ncbi:hypothetical protein U6N30_25285 [Blastococcus brunescens]|uniref:Uncharacterized protein n=1 Tax=Blastococcus brunescens TaxID=1564165 RepID=A0ABZ1AX08_9ACTN|nr:hypothetical protein [Blastococcus sp. BMG 8361]WRL63099.1 hypothetical protein U6N30_25285 [Blastococcus sp. BMG 8361]
MSFVFRVITGFPRDRRQTEPAGQFVGAGNLPDDVGERREGERRASLLLTARRAGLVPRRAARLAALVADDVLGRDLQGAGGLVDHVPAEQLGQVEVQRGGHVGEQGVATGLGLAVVEGRQRAVRERIGEQQFQRAGQVRSGRRQLAEDRLEELQVGDRVGRRRVDHPGAHVAEAGQALEHGDEQVALLVDDVEAGADGVQGGADGGRAGGQRLGQPVGAVQRPADLDLLRVQAADEGVELVEGVLELGRAALHRLAEFPVDGLELGEAAAVEHQRHGAQELLHLHVPVGARQWDDR